MSDTNVGMGIVPHKATCGCDDCTIDNLRAKRREQDKRIEELEAGQQAAVDKALEEVALMVEGRAESRFAEYGTVETDTGASYYSGSGGMFLDERDEEDEEIATAIRSRIKGEGK